MQSKSNLWVLKETLKAIPPQKTKIRFRLKLNVRI